MSKHVKIGLVLGGYSLACLASAGIVRVYQLFTQDPAAQASAGMYAFGDVFLFLGVYGGLAFIPTILAIFFLIKK